MNETQPSAKVVDQDLGHMNRPASFGRYLYPHVIPTLAPKIHFFIYFSCAILYPKHVCSWTRNRLHILLRCITHSKPERQQETEEGNRSEREHRVLDAYPPAMPASSAEDAKFAVTAVSLVDSVSGISIQKSVCTQSRR